MKSALVGFLQVDIHVPDYWKEMFSEFCPLFIVDTIPEEMIQKHMKEYQERTGRKTIWRTQKLLGVMCAEQMFLYMPLLKWYLRHGLKVTTIHKYLNYKPGRPFEWFPEEVRRDLMATTTQPWSNLETSSSSKEICSVERQSKTSRNTKG